MNGTKILQGFMGDSMQIPPMYSALKKDGKRLYELARKGETVERDPRPIRIDQIRLLEAAGTRLVFRVSCSKGTYVRTLVEDIARKAGTVAHTVRLHRETVGRFRAEDMQDLATIEAQAEQDQDSLTGQLAAPGRGADRHFRRLISMRTKRRSSVAARRYRRPVSTRTA